MESLEAKVYCASAFLDISQAFDRVWHEGLLFKLKKYFTTSPVWNTKIISTAAPFYSTKWGSTV